MEDVILDYKRERCWRMVFEDNDGGEDNEKSLLHANRLDIYLNKKKDLMKGVYSVELLGSDGNKFLW